MKYIIFDIETNGLPKDYRASIEDVDNWPRITQLAWQIYNDDETLHSEMCDLIRPYGWEIPKEKFWIDNGFSTEKSLAEGVPINMALAHYVAMRASVPVAIAHNYSFDGMILRSEMFRLGLSPEFNSQKVCTMKASTKYCNLPGTRGPKWPKLEELHRYLFNEDFEGAHDALSDVKATARCFFELKRLGIITL